MLVDTSVWSLALRRIQPGPASVVEELGKLVRERRVAMMGPIRQEILSGVKGAIDDSLAPVPGTIQS